MSDLIRREEVFDIINEEISANDNIYAISALLTISHFVSDLPSAPQWIPCEERLPNEDGMYLTTIENIMGKASVISGFRNGIWQTQFDVIAWMMKPKAYEGRTE